ncbi:MAG: DUF6569 family protein [Candidatus Krumholzibacteria bacterium]
MLNRNHSPQPDSPAGPYRWPEVRLGAPCTSVGLTVFPIVNGQGGGGDYILLADAVEKNIATVTEVNRGGDIPVILIENRTKTPLLGIQGEEYIGAKQNRTLNISVLAGPGKTRIPVTCAEQGRWAPGASNFSAGTYETMAVRMAKNISIADTKKSVKDGFAKFFADQGLVWNSIRRDSARYGASSPTMAMNEMYESAQVKDPLAEIVDGIEVPADTRGVVVAIGGRLVAADIFEHPNVFGCIWPRILRSYGLSALHVKKGVPPSVEVAEAFVSRPGATAWSATPSVGMGEDVRWESKDILASALVWQERFLHATMFSRDAA